MGGNFGTDTFKFGQDVQVREDPEPRKCPAGGTSQLQRCSDRVSR